MAMAAVAVLLGLSGLAAPPERQDVPELWERVQIAIDAGDAQRVVELVSGVGDSEAVAAIYGSVVRSLYYSGRNLPAVVLVAQQGIDFTLSEAVLADRRGDSEAARRFRGRAKELAYDLASFTWPGWAEPGIGIRTSDLDAGIEAARLNLRLAEELGRGPEAMANARFILGGHSLAAGNYEAAESHFRRFGEIAREAGLEELAIVADGYLVMTSAASRSGTPGDYMIEPVRERLRRLPDSRGDFWIDQLNAAWSVFVTG